MKNLRRTSIAGVIIATISLYWIVPENPMLHLDDPSHWGIIGYLSVLLVISSAKLAGQNRGALERNLLTGFLLAMPLIYIANWIRYDQQSYWFWVELMGVIIYWAIAFLSKRVSLLFLAFGIGAHAIWDIWHFNQGLYVPNWYVIGCTVIDVAAGFYALVQIKYWDLAFKSGGIRHVD